MRISVFGIGYVGAVSSACLAAEGHGVTAVDVSAEKIASLNEGRAPIIEAGLDALIASAVAAGKLSATDDAARAVAESELSVICVGTPSLANGNLDLSHVVRVCESIGRALGRKAERHTVVVRSTILPGSMRETVLPVLERSSGRHAGAAFGVAFYPEFLREGSAIRDYREPGIVVIGVEDAASEALLRGLVGPAGERLHVTDFATAEALKYANNAWHASKIVFANEIGTYCKSVGIDGQKVMDLLCADRRLNISAAYLRPGFAYGGSCLPKDLRALQYSAKAHDLALPLVEALAVSNARHVRRAFEMVEATGHRRVGLIGLSFKSGTDDLRESPTVELAETLYGKGYQLRIFDRNVHLSKLMGANLSYVQTHIPHLSELLTADLGEVVAFGDTLVVSSRDFDGKGLAGLRDEQVLIDLVRLESEARPQGGIYNGICW